LLLLHGLVNTPTPPAKIPPPEATAFAHQVAKASWVCPVIVFLLLIFGPRGSRYIIGLAADLFLIVGLVFSFISLLGIRKHGSKGLLVPTIVGLILNGLLLSMLISALLRAKTRAQVHTGGAPSPFALVSLGAWPNHALHLTRPSRPGCNRTPSWAAALSLGRSATGF
jgi:hypothetical protein